MHKGIHLLKSTVPETSGKLEMDGVEKTVQIFRDTYGIAHVLSETSHDAFFAQGFVTAQDRFWHMDCDRHRAYGRWSEWMGASAISQDRMMRKFQIAATVKQDYESASEPAKTMLDAYAQGVNAFLDSARAWPVEYELLAADPERWQPWDGLAVYKVRHILMGVFEGKLWRSRLIQILGAENASRLLQGYQAGHLMVVPPLSEYQGAQLEGLEILSQGLEYLQWLQSDPDWGSNNWVLSGSRTASGKPLLAGDPHRSLDVPNVYYQNHIACRDFDVIGLSFPGCPGFPHFGHNAHVAWCVTHTGADYQDLYVEHFQQQQEGICHASRGQWKQTKVISEVIKVKNGPSEVLDVRVTDHGPVIMESSDGRHGIALKYTATSDVNRTADCLVEMLSSDSIDSLDCSMREWVDPCNNFLFADVHGDVGYLSRGKIPLRPEDNAWLPVPGWTGSFEWDGVIPFEEMPRIRNPESGFIVTANNRVTGEDYPYYIALDYAPEYRARRLATRLQAISSASVEDMLSIHADCVSIPAQTYCAVLSSGDGIDPQTVEALSILKDWDASMNVDSVAASIYSAMRNRLHEKVLNYWLGPLSKEAMEASGRGAPGHIRQLTSALVTMAANRDDTRLPPGENWTDLLLQSLADGVEDLKQRWGEDMSSWQWGRGHHTRPNHPLSALFPEWKDHLDPSPVAAGGDGDTPQAAGYAFQDPFVMTSTSVARYVFDTSNWNQSRWIVPLGNSGNPGSRHYSDQSTLWGEVKTVPMWYDWKDIEKQCQSHQQLDPVHA